MSFGEPQRPAAGPIAFPSFRDGLRADELVDTLREREGVLLLPGSCYGDYPRNFRIGFGRRDFPEALARFDAFLRAQRG